MKKIKIDFVDFWSDFDKTNNYFHNVLIEKYDVEISSTPDVVFYSCFGREYLKYKCKRVLFLGENKRPDLTACDFAFSFDYVKRKKHFRLPLYSLYIELHDFLVPLKETLTGTEAEKEWKKKSKFCCMVVSNPNCKERISFFHKLSKVKKVDSGGRYLNNIGGPVDDKYDFIKDYKFVLSFENEKHDGYTTEKVMEPILKHSVPIYWGNNLVGKDFNTKRFLNYSDFKSEEDLIDKIIEIDENDELGIEMLQQHTYSKERLDFEEERQKVLACLTKVIENKRKPIAQTKWRFIHKLKLKYPSSKKYLRILGV